MAAKTARRTTEAVRVGTAKGQYKGARKAPGYAGRSSAASRSGMSDSGLSANNRGSGGKSSVATAVGSAGGGTILPGREVVESTTGPAGAPVAPPGTTSSAAVDYAARRAPRDLSPSEPVSTLRVSSLAASTPTATTRSVAKTPAKPKAVAKPKPKPKAKPKTAPRRSTARRAAPVVRKKPGYAPSTKRVSGPRRSTARRAAPAPKKRPTTRRSSARR